MGIARLFLRAAMALTAPLVHCVPAAICMGVAQPQAHMPKVVASMQ